MRKVAGELRIVDDGCRVILDYPLTTLSPLTTANKELESAKALAVEHEQKLREVQQREQSLANDQHQHDAEIAAIKKKVCEMEMEMESSSGMMMVECLDWE